MKIIKKFLAPILFPLDAIRVLMWESENDGI